MKAFLLEFLKRLIAFILLFEIFLRIMGIAGARRPTCIIDGDFLLQPGAKGAYREGAFGEINATYHINPQGFNSLVDYHQPTDKPKIALIGDSFIEGIHSNVSQSVGRILEERMNHEIVVHEYGTARWNIFDFEQAYEKFVKGKYDAVFIYLGSEDIKATRPNYMGVVVHQREQSPFEASLQKIRMIQYFEQNLVLKEIIKMRWKNLMSKKENAPPKKLKFQHGDMLKKFQEEVCFLYESDRLNTEFINPADTSRLLEIKPIHLPKNFGFNKHWNLNGRKNCALAMEAKLRELGYGQAPEVKHQTD